MNCRLNVHVKTARWNEAEKQVDVLAVFVGATEFLTCSPGSVSLPVNDLRSGKLFQLEKSVSRSSRWNITQYSSVESCCKFFSAPVQKWSIGTLIKNFYFLLITHAPHSSRSPCDLSEGRDWRARNERQRQGLERHRPGMMIDNHNKASTQNNIRHIRWDSCWSRWEIGLSLFVQLKHGVMSGMYIIPFLSCQIYFMAGDFSKHMKVDELTWSLCVLRI